MKEISLDKQVSQQQNKRFFSQMRKQQGRLLTRKQYENKGNAKLNLMNETQMTSQNTDSEVKWILIKNIVSDWAWHHVFKNREE